MHYAEATRPQRVCMKRKNPHNNFRFAVQRLIIFSRIYFAVLIHPLLLKQNSIGPAILFPIYPINMAGRGPIGQRPGAHRHVRTLVCRYHAKTQPDAVNHWAYLLEMCHWGPVG